MLTTDALNVSQLVQMHHSQTKNDVVLFDLPTELKPIRDLKKGLEIIWQLERSIFLLPLLDSNFSHAYFDHKIMKLTLSFEKLNICDADMSFKKADNRKRNIVEDLTHTLLVHLIN